MNNSVASSHPNAARENDSDKWYMYILVCVQRQRQVTWTPAIQLHHDIVQLDPLMLVRSTWIRCCQRNKRSCAVQWHPLYDNGGGRGLAAAAVFRRSLLLACVERCAWSGRLVLHTRLSSVQVQTTQRQHTVIDDTFYFREKQTYDWSLHNITIFVLFIPAVLNVLINFLGCIEKCFFNIFAPANKPIAYKSSICSRRLVVESLRNSTKWNTNLNLRLGTAFQEEKTCKMRIKQGLMNNTTERVCY